ncbi:MAG: DUF1071 domain-containing protein [Blautia sp.]
MEENYFKQLYDIDVRSKTKVKNNLNYLSWAAAWAEVKKLFPTATFHVYEENIEITENIDGREVKKSIGRPWFDDGNTGWVKTGVTIHGIEHIEELPVMDFKNRSLEASKITSADANKAIQRSITKACARHGLGLYIYEGEDLPQELKETEKLQAECMEVITKRSALSQKTKERVAEICKELLPEENGDPRLCDVNEKLETLKKRLIALRKIA